MIWLRLLAIFWLLLGCATGFSRETATDPVALAELPPEARHTLRLIEQGGPFPYSRDGIVFGNFEKRLPLHPRGHYHEYTVDTPGRRDRGPRRIIAAGNPPGKAGYYYTDDHYRTFRRIQEAP